MGKASRKKRIHIAMFMDGCDRLFSLQTFPTIPVGYILWCPLVCTFSVFLFRKQAYHPRVIMSLMVGSLRFSEAEAEAGRIRVLQHKNSTRAYINYIVCSFQSSRKFSI